MARGPADLAPPTSGPAPPPTGRGPKGGRAPPGTPRPRPPEPDAGRLQGEPRLAAATRPGEGEEAGSGEEPPYLLELPRAPDEAQKLQRQVAERPEGLLPRTAAPQGDRRVLDLRASSWDACYQPTERTIPAM